MTLFACDTKPNPDAKGLCDCYAEVYRTSDEEAQHKHDSCMTIYKDILERHKNDQRAMKAFVEAYRACQ